MVEGNQNNLNVVFLNYVMNVIQRKKPLQLSTITLQKNYTTHGTRYSNNQKFSTFEISKKGRLIFLFDGFLVLFCENLERCGTKLEQHLKFGKRTANYTQAYVVIFLIFDLNVSVYILKYCCKNFSFHQIKSYCGAFCNLTRIIFVNDFLINKRFSNSRKKYNESIFVIVVFESFGVQIFQASYVFRVRSVGELTPTEGSKSILI